MRVLTSIDDDAAPVPETAIAKRRDRRMLAALAVVFAAIIGLLVTVEGRPAPDSDEQARDRRPATQADENLGSDTTPAVPPALLAAERFAADPAAGHLRELVDVLGGFEGLEVATAEGAFDLVSFDPNDTSRLLASHRLSYGDAENQTENEIWHVLPTGEVEQTIWQPSIVHDFVHFNTDGTATMWVNGGGGGYAPRVATALDRDLEPVGAAEPMYASRFTSVGGTVFALTGNGDYYTNEQDYVDLVADDGSGLRVLDDGASYGWIDNPTPDVLVAYPSELDGGLMVWDTADLHPRPSHPLAGRPYRRVAVSGDRTVAVGATFDGQLEVLDMATGVAVGTFGSVDVGGVGQPITLNADGSIASIVEATGRVSIWWVGSETPAASVMAHQGQPRWVSAENAPRTTSVISADGSRMALLSAARADQPTRWTIVDTDPESWIERACAEAGRALTDEEAEAFGLADSPRACVDPDL